MNKTKIPTDAMNRSPYTRTDICECRVALATEKRPKITNNYNDALSLELPSKNIKTSKKTKQIFNQDKEKDLIGFSSIYFHKV